jgi:hypothetical protein
MASTQGRRAAFEELRTVGWPVPFLYSLLIFFLAISFFTALTLQLHRFHLVSFGDPNQDAIITWNVASFFAWHLADAIPLVAVTETLRWDEPLQYDDVRIGGLVLCYQLLVILPLIAAFANFWNFHRSRHRPTSLPSSSASKDESDTIDELGSPNELNVQAPSADEDSDPTD